MSTPPTPAVHLDRSALAMLAHPLRSRLLDELRLSGPATATTLAAVLHTNSGATSYHLRKLAEVALVVDQGTGGKRTGRRRLWSASTESRPRDEGPSDDTDDPDAQAAMTWLARDYLRLFNDRAEQWLDGPSSGWTPRTGGPLTGASRPACRTIWCRSRPGSSRRCAATWPRSWDATAGSEQATPTPNGSPSISAPYRSTVPAKTDRQRSDVRQSPRGLTSPAETVRSGALRVIAGRRPPPSWPGRSVSM